MYGSLARFRGAQTGGYLNEQVTDASGTPIPSIGGITVKDEGTTVGAGMDTTSIDVVGPNLTATSAGAGAVTLTNRNPTGYQFNVRRFNVPVAAAPGEPLWVTSTSGTPPLTTWDIRLSQYEVNAPSVPARNTVVRMEFYSKFSYNRDYTLHVDTAIFQTWVFSTLQPSVAGALQGLVDLNGGFALDEHISTAIPGVLNRYMPIQLNQATATEFTFTNVGIDLLSINWNNHFVLEYMTPNVA